MTFAGKRKIAFFAEKPLRDALGALTGIAPAAPFGVIDPFALPGPKKPSAPLVVEITRLAPVSLFDPAFDGDVDLLGTPSAAASTAPATLAAKALYVDGIAPPAVAGRVDEIGRP